MGVTRRDRRVMERQSRDLGALETDDPANDRDRRKAIDAANRDRRAAGTVQLDEQDEEPDEVEFYRRARALGLGRVSG